MEGGREGERRTEGHRSRRDRSVRSSSKVLKTVDPLTFAWAHGSYPPLPLPLSRSVVLSHTGAARGLSLLIEVVRSVRCVLKGASPRVLHDPQLSTTCEFSVTLVKACLNLPLPGTGANSEPGCPRPLDRAET